MYQYALVVNDFSVMQEVSREEVRRIQQTHQQLIEAYYSAAVPDGVPELSPENRNAIVKVIAAAAADSCGGSDGKEVVNQHHPWSLKPALPVRRERTSQAVVPTLAATLLESLRAKHDLVKTRTQQFRGAQRDLAMSGQSEKRMLVPHAPATPAKHGGGLYYGATWAPEASQVGAYDGPAGE